MNKLFESFPKPSKQNWIDLLQKELKGADFESNLIKSDPIEALNFPSFFHQSDLDLKAEVPGIYPYKRGSSPELNDWHILSGIDASDAKQANKKALHFLMTGSTGLILDCNKTTKLDLENLLKDIELDYIKLYFQVSSAKQMQEIQARLKDKSNSELVFLWNPLSNTSKLSAEDLQLVQHQSSMKTLDVDSYGVQQAGANSTQEIAFALSLGHEYLWQQIEAGLTVDDSLSNLHFTMGVGSNFLVEIAKFRAFRILWAKIARSYKPEHACNETASITAKTGFLNKSLKDPYTNLLRQTTEAMSAVLGGANQLWIQPYDACSTNPDENFSQRMATNISLILKEESYLNQVLDPVGGSYAVEWLTEQLADKAWKLFQESEGNGGVFGLTLKEKIRETAKLRLKNYEKKAPDSGEIRKTLIGVTKFPNPQHSDNEWLESASTYFELDRLIIEHELSKLELPISNK